jgi:hypothetical protein
MLYVRCLKTKHLAMLALLLLVPPFALGGKPAATTTTISAKSKPPAATPVPVTVEILPGYRYQSDGLGLYYDLVGDLTRRSVLDYNGAGFDFFRTNNYTPDPSTRKEIINLDLPVPGGGATQTYTFDSNGIIHHLQTPTKISNLAVGASLPVSLQFGADTEPGGVHPQASALLICGSGLAAGGTGTNQAVATRTSSTQWQITLPLGSICRLWLPSGNQKVNAGLYYFDADVILTVQ